MISRLVLKNSTFAISFKYIRTRNSGQIFGSFYCYFTAVFKYISVRFIACLNNVLAGYGGKKMGQKSTAGMGHT